MALSCPNKSLPEWKSLVDEVGEREALNDYFQFGRIRTPFDVKDKLKRLNIANYTNEKFEIGERVLQSTVDYLIEAETNSSIVDAMLTHMGHRGVQDEESFIKRVFTDDTIEYVGNTQERQYQKGYKSVVQELFESNPELANQVYEALEFNFRYTSEKWKDEKAQQLYSQYLSNFVNTNFDGIIADLQAKNLLEKKCS